VKRIVLAESLDGLRALPSAFARLVYIDPPFNTGKLQHRRRIRVTADARRGVRAGFGDKRYREREVPSPSFDDRIGSEYVDWLVTRVRAAIRCTTDDASFFVHLDAREVHYVKVALDGLFGREHFMNEIVWAYDYGARSKRRWPAKHDTILWYVRDPERYVFRYDAMDRIPYMAPGLVGAAKAARGKTPTDVWWHTIVPTNGREKTGYPTQKPLGILERIVKVHSEPGDVVLDFFAGSGTTGAAAAKHGRGFVLIDRSPAAVQLMKKRLHAEAPAVSRA